ncbi:MAG: glycosyltransferase family 4 protein [Acidimicrobiales bacterium]
MQYFFAAEKSLEYHLPFRSLEVVGTKIHRHFIVVSESFLDPIQAINQQATIDIVHPGVSPLAATEPAERGGLLFLGRLEFGMKGLDLLVEAFAVILSDWPEIRLRIAGDGPDRGRFERLLSERGLADKVDLLGRIEGNLKWDALRRADVVLMPSRYETFGLVALEAMSVGTPTVAFAIPSLRGLVGDTGSAVLVEPEDAIGLGRAVSALLSSPDRRRQISAAGRLRATAFDWDEAAREHDRIYRIAANDKIDRSARARLRQLFSATYEYARDRLRRGQFAPERV